MDKQHNRTPNNLNAGRIWAGLIIIGIGVVLLAGKLGLGWLFPAWLFNWHTLWPLTLVLSGLIVGGNSNFRNPVSVFLIILGLLFLTKNLFRLDIGAFIFPLIIIAVGFWLLVGNRYPCRHRPGPGGGRRYRRDYDASYGGEYEWDRRVKPDDAGSGIGNTTTSPDGDETSEDTQKGPASGGANGFRNLSADDYLKVTTIFGEVKKIVITKRFQGGEVVNIFGGTDVNLIQSDIQGPVVIDVFQLFAGMKIIIPSHWKVQSDVVSVFGEVDDKRFTQGIPQDDQKVLYIRGTSVFGGVTIKNI